MKMMISGYYGNINQWRDDDDDDADDADDDDDGDDGDDAQKMNGVLSCGQNKI